MTPGKDLEFMDRAIADHRGGVKNFRTAFRRQKGEADRPGVVFLSGFKSDMDGSKAEALAAWCRTENLDYLRFDYFGHGLSGGEFTEGTVSLWRRDVFDMIEKKTSGPQIVVGSSFGGWLALMAACHKPLNVAGLVLIAPAADMTENMRAGFDASMLEALEAQGICHLPSDYDETGYPITRDLIEDGRQHLMLEKGIAFQGPVSILHGQLDDAVPWRLSLEIKDALESREVDVTLVKNGDHRLSEPEDLDLLTATLQRLVNRLRGRQ